MSVASEHAVLDVHESIVNDDAVTHHTFAPGDVALQGDVIFVGIARLPESAKPRKDRQLADGNTQGSRHILKGGRCYDCEAAEVVKLIAAACKGAKIDAKYVGPVFVTTAEVTHPEHGNHRWPKSAGKQIVAVVYQRNLDAEEREQRVQD